MSQRLRFECVSSSLALHKLLNKAGQAVWIALAVGTAAHLSLMKIRDTQGEASAVKPLTTQFVKRQPRLSKPLELKKRPQPKRRLVSRRVVAVAARARSKSEAGGVRPADMATRLARPVAHLARTVSLGEARFDAGVLSESVTGTREPADRMAMGLEMLDIEALDTGKYHALVVQDPSDKRGVQGFLHIAMVVPALSSYDVNGWISGIRRLAELGMNRYTAIRTDIWPPLTFDSREMFKVPWLLTIDLSEYHDEFADLTLTGSEQRNLGAYLMRGGFVHADAFPPPRGKPLLPALTLRKIIQDALDTQGPQYGRDWSFERLPESHALYHCYFDFDGPPMGYAAGNPDFQDVPFLEGVTIDHRLLAIISQMYYAHVWGFWGSGGRGTGSAMDPGRNLQFGVNIIVFALTQEGSITHRLMDAIQ